MGDSKEGMPRVRLVQPVVLAGLAFVVVLAVMVGYRAMHVGKGANLSSIVSGYPHSLLAAPADYPAVIKPLSADQLSFFQNRFTMQNPGICDQLDAFGFVERQSGCAYHAGSSFFDSAAAEAAARNWIANNQIAVGVRDPSQLKVESSVKTAASYKVRFAEQQYKGMPVVGTDTAITIFLDASNAWRVEGHWFPVINVPDAPAISEAAARKRLIGKQVSYSDYGGNGQTVQFTESSITAPAKPIIFIKKSGTNLEMRLAWRITAGGGGPWEIIMDAMTGEELQTVQKFNT